MAIDAAAEEQFGPYLVYERLGVGGMATVHRALERGAEGFERIVALKRLLPHLAEDASFIKSFVREAKLASLLHHVNIVQIYELGRVGAEYFISMEYIDGRDVRRVLRHARKVTGPPPIHVTVGLMIQLCEALDYAHHKVDDDGQALKLVHRDISPSNLLVTSAGHLKIIDFGIAKAQSSQLRTQTGRVKGKLAYMAPEAISGSKDLDARSDIWAAGVILHELLTARPLFASKNEYQTLLKVQRGDIMPPSTFNQACPPELDAIVFRALARDPDQRFAGASDLRDELLDVRRIYGLQTGYRDVAQWIDWAFSLEQPASFGHMDSSGVMSVDSPRTPLPRAKTPRPARNKEEDEAVEMVWGTGNHDSDDAGPVLLDDVPDVSDKHLAPRMDTEAEGEVDDIPTPAPTHGPNERATPPVVYGTSEDLVVVVPQQSSGVARGSDRMGAQRASGVHPAQPIRGRASTPPPMQRQPDRLPTQTSPNRTTSPGIAVPRDSSANTGNFRAHRPSTSGTGPVPSVDTPAMGERIAAQRARDSVAPPLRNTPQPRVRADSVSGTTPEGSPLPDHDASDSRLDPSLLFDPDAADTLDGSATARSHSEAELPSVPVVRFSKQQAVPAVPAGLEPLPPASGLDSLRPPPSTKPGLGVGVTIASPVKRKKPPSEVTIGAAIAARGKKPRRGVLLVGGLVIAGAAATGVTLLLTRGEQVEAKHEPPPALSTHTTGTVKFVVEPADAEIRLEGQLEHTGSPWTLELPAGIHQIELRKQGYKAWLTSIELSAREIQTLRVVLEPLGGHAASTEATLSLSTTPAGLDAVLDGQVLPQRTPLKISIKAGAHTISLRQNGVEVWHQNLNAEAASDYEFNPSFTADKLRERAERATTPKPEHSEPAEERVKEPANEREKEPASEPKTEPKNGKSAEVEDKMPPAPTFTTGSAVAALPHLDAAVAQVDRQAPAPPPPIPHPAAIAQPAPSPSPAPPAPAAITRPVLVAPTAVQKVAGSAPNISKSRSADLPPVVAAKLCIDTTGKVTTVDPVSKIDRIARQDLIDALQTWRYAPYRANGAPAPACFVVTLRVQ